MKSSTDLVGLKTLIVILF